ncbi:hypothetical protein [Primorskyibacter sp. S87]|uniref:hypothetical protein n=1 Tax=Primorskyibacter sp. S87 TaxID=3415126 RepID=UPI003C7D1D9A
MARVIAVNLAILLGLLVILELIFGTWFSREHALYQFTQVRDQVIIRENPLPEQISGGIETITYTRDAYGFRGLSSPVSEIDILTVGGSTTDQRWIDDSQTYQAELEGIYSADGNDVEIVNAGIDGQSTFGHIQNFDSWFAKIPQMKAGYILFYIGINDALILKGETLFDDMQTAGMATQVKGFIKEHSAVFQLYRVAQGLMAEKPIRHELNRSNIADQQELTDKPLISGEMAPHLQASLDGLASRVAELDRLTREFGAIPIFVTQRSARWLRRDGKVLGIAKYEPDFFELVRKTLPPQLQELNGVDFYNFERATADTIMATCQNKQAICLDLVAELDFDNAADFYDAIHTTPAGSRQIARYLHAKLSELGIPES